MNIWYFGECAFNCTKIKVHMIVSSFSELIYELVSSTPNVSYGFVNISRDEGSGLLCSNAPVDENLASALCRAAGYIYGGMPFTSRLDLPIYTNVWRNHLYCSTNGMNVENCANNKWNFGHPLNSSSFIGTAYDYPCDGSHDNLVRIFCFQKSGSNKFCNYFIIFIHQCKIVSC